MEKLNAAKPNSTPNLDGCWLFLGTQIGVGFVCILVGLLISAGLSFAAVVIPWQAISLTLHGTTLGLQVLRWVFVR